ncbi:hypothetical protein [Schumannella sp. 10F1B-5-1]|uniref:hypothetical protein n=1 Tax=Schumannella sp. 10F1B-5-1 TaxID=2590780 RepID=UPI0011323CF8|nr:hypothetical protein [Schumannella sp. 10F1B-5-1]TPW72325.1 hypothetical protein FJ658_08635 [Schumannella sp. 10F1B-5-1]
MPFRLILPASRQRLATPAMSGDVEALRKDYGRASRLLIEVGLTLVAVLGALVLAAGLTGATSGLAWVGVATAVVGALLFGGAVAGLVPFARSGSVLSRALARALQDRHGGRRQRGAGDALSARLHVFEPYLFWRIAVAALALLGAIMFLSIGGRALATDAVGTGVGMLAAGALLAIEGVVLFIATTRINVAHSLRDPIQHRLLGRPGE